MGQPHVAGALLALLDGCAVHTISLPALVMSGTFRRVLANLSSLSLSGK